MQMEVSGSRRGHFRTADLNGLKGGEGGWGCHMAGRGWARTRSEDQVRPLLCHGIYFCPSYKGLGFTRWERTLYFIRFQNYFNECMLKAKPVRSCTTGYSTDSSGTYQPEQANSFGQADVLGQLGLGAMNPRSHTDSLYREDSS